MPISEKCSAHAVARGKVLEESPVGFVIASEAKQSSLRGRRVDCFVASLLAMTDKNRGGFADGHHPAGPGLCRRAARRDAGRRRGRRRRLCGGARGVRATFGAAVSRPGGERRGPARLLVPVDRKSVV